MTDKLPPRHERLLLRNWLEYAKHVLGIIADGTIPAYGASDAAKEALSILACAEDENVPLE